MPERTRRASGRPAEYAAPESELLRDVRAGFSTAQKTLPPKYFYDARGSELFARITRLEEYYPTRLERGLLAAFAAPWLSRLGARALVELGAGNADKTRTLLDALGDGATYVPVDISAEFLHASAERLRAEYPRLHIEPVVGDLTHLPPRVRPAEGPVVFAFLGSTIGNFEESEAVQLLAGVRRQMHAGDVLLLGADLVKDPGVLERAYNDDAGVTAEFNRNVLRVLNRELGTDFEPERFRHVAYYDTEAARIEMHLVSLADQHVSVPGWRTVHFARGESIRTEVSCKYTHASLERTLRAAGLRSGEWTTDARGWYALVVASPVAAAVEGGGASPAARAPRTVEEAAEWIRAELVPRPRTAPRIGVEYELLVQHADTHAPAQWAEGAGALARWLEAHAAEREWTRDASAKGAPKYRLPHGGMVTLEPGGQLEYAGPPFASADAAIADLDAAIAPLHESARGCGLELLAAGLDPHNPLEAVPLQFDSPRYRRMHRYFARQGDAGARMMRQTASLQLNLDVSGDFEESWRLLNALVPDLVTLYANSRTADAHSERARIWRTLDPARTGAFPCIEDCATEYARFALAAPAMLLDGRRFDAEPRTLAEWHEHLSTLFPEVRLRGYLELRSIDALPLARAADAIRFVCGLLWNDEARTEALRIVGSPDARLLDVAWQEGPENETLRTRAERLLAVSGATSAARTPLPG